MLSHWDSCRGRESFSFMFSLREVYLEDTVCSPTVTSVEVERGTERERGSRSLFSVKRDLLYRQRRPTKEQKETYIPLLQ